VEEKEVKKGVRWDVFIPCFVVIGGSALLGVLHNEWLTKVTQAIFGWSLETFGWLYQWVAIGTLIMIALLTFSPLGKIWGTQCQSQILLWRLVCHDPDRGHCYGPDYLRGQ